MSSYLNFYLKPKNKPDAEPMRFINYSRASDVYQWFREECNPAFIGNADKPKYTELSVEDCKKVLDAAKKNLEITNQRFADRVEAFQKLTIISQEALNDYIQDYTETKKYIEELKETVAELECIYYWVSEIIYSDFEKVLINIE